MDKRQAEQIKEVTGIIGYGPHGVPVVAVVRDGIHLVWWCQRCKRFHLHGAKGGGGHRVTHCEHVPDYELKVVRR